MARIVMLPMLGEHVINYVNVVALLIHETYCLLLRESIVFMALRRHRHIVVGAWQDGLRRRLAGGDAAGHHYNTLSRSVSSMS